MKIENGKIIITNPVIMNFLTLNKGNDNVIRLFEEVMENYCKTIDDFMENYDKTEKNKRDTTEMIKYLQEFERRQIESNKLIDEKLENITTTVNDKIASQIMGLMVTIDKNISGSINENIKRCLESDVANKNKELELTIKGELTTQIKEPLQKILSGFNGNNEILMREVRELERKVNEMMRTTLDKFQESKEISNLQKEILVEQVKKIPTISKDIFTEIVRPITERNDELEDVLASVQKDNLENLTIIKSNTQQILQKSLKEKYLSSEIGKEAQTTIHELLQRRLLESDGYDVDNCSVVKHSTDIVIKRVKSPPVRVEIKNYKYSVDKEEISKFLYDLQMTNNHGILVSLYTGIQGKRQTIELSQLPNGKFAIYLSYNNYNIDTIIDMLNLIYKLDSVLNLTSDGEIDGIRKLSQETVEKLKYMISSIETNILETKHHLKQATDSLNKIIMKQIENLVLEDKEFEIQKYICDYCKKDMKNKGGLTTHLMYCKYKKNAIIDEEDINVDEEIKKKPKRERAKNKKGDGETLML